MSIKKIINKLNSCLSSAENQWLQEALQQIQSSEDPQEELLNLSAVVKRKLVSLNTLDENDFVSNQVSELVRICLISQVINSHPELKVSAILKAYYQAGDSTEKAAMLKGLCLLDTNGEAVNVAVNAARCNSADEFSALALNNDYPSEFFAELNFNQLVLKALFMGLQIIDLRGLQNRLSVQLSNMCFSYAVEQALAERIPPASLWLAVRYVDLTTEHKAYFEQYTQHFAQVDLQHKDRVSALIEEQNLIFN
ncbi:EboA domain-containing protein [Paraglaciecola aquimarina]|uniref:EboA domain-containing protein n=1 Tax=Paraglaciecola algarum TaxID=3050085 RepID=A0ABS9D1Y9_9ALTE|nr:EboA domain-containing protein [Paraglaciecola sp. G1-23]MCF2946923.1 EboA domain-containing protein [Paraglaciecola sp. G1-23]